MGHHDPGDGERADSPATAAVHDDVRRDADHNVGQRPRGVGEEERSLGGEPEDVAAGVGGARIQVCG